MVRSSLEKEGWPQIFDFSKNPSLQDHTTLSYLQAFALPLSFELRALYLSPRLLPEGFLPLSEVLLSSRCSLLVVQTTGLSLLFDILSIRWVTLEGWPVLCISVGTYLKSGTVC